LSSAKQKKTDMFVGFGAGTQITLWQDYFGQDYLFSGRWSDFYAEAGDGRAALQAGLLCYG
jgi:hypothetical protein